MRELDVIWVLVPLAILSVGYVLFRLGVEVGKDQR